MQQLSTAKPISPLQGGHGLIIWPTSLIATCHIPLKTYQSYLFLPFCRLFVKLWFGQIALKMKDSFKVFSQTKYCSLRDSILDSKRLQWNHVNTHTHTSVSHPSQFLQTGSVASMLWPERNQNGEGPPHAGSSPASSCTQSSESRHFSSMQQPDQPGHIWSRLKI